MADPKGFLAAARETPQRRPVDVRIKDWREVYHELERDKLGHQAGRCMDCGIPFCHQGCPLGNLIPEWNDLVRRGDWRTAIERLHATNNFPEFTGTLCPAPCESACVLGINSDAVTIKQVEMRIIDRAWDEGWVQPERPVHRSGMSVGVVGSGPAGLAAAQQLTRTGHAVTVYERADRIGGLLRYGIPEFKMEKWRLDRRLTQLAEEGTIFRTGVCVGADVSVAALRSEHDAVVLAGGASVARELPVPGGDLAGVHQAMEYLPWANKVCEGDLRASPISAEGKHVVVIGGGDTGADCVGTAHRQGACSVTQLEIMPTPPLERDGSQPWPTYPMVLRTGSAHEEGGQRLFSVSTREFVGDEQGRVRGLWLDEVKRDQGGFVPIEGTSRELPCDLALLALGFVGPENAGLLSDLGVEQDARGNVSRDESFMTSIDGVFAAGDTGRGQSLIVWAISEGRSAAAGVDRYLTGRDVLPVPVSPSDRPLS